MVCLLLLSLPALAYAQENITQELDADLNAAFPDLSTQGSMGDIIDEIVQEFNSIPILDRPEIQVTANGIILLSENTTTAINPNQP